MEDITGDILAKLKAGASRIEVPSYIWSRHGGTVAGASHLPKDKQLEAWCGFNGFHYAYDAVRHVHLISKRQ